MFRAGIPVYYIRPYGEIIGIRVRALVTTQSPQSLLPLNPATNPKHPRIWTGASTDPKRYRALDDYVIDHFIYPDPFAAVRSEFTTQPTPSADTKAVAKQRQFSPCMYQL